MSGHNKWSQIKHKKAITDAKKGKLFSKLVRFITVETKKVNGDRGAQGLRAAIEKARKANMPSDNIERAIKKAAEPGNQMEGITYEAYGPAGVGLIVEALTDNRNRAVQEIKHVLTKNGATFSGTGSVTWAFEKKEDGWHPQTTILLSDEDLQKLDKLINDLEDIDDVQEVFTNAE